MKSKVLIEIRGGTLVGVYTNDSDTEIHVVDWDDVAAGDDTPSRMLPGAWDDMPTETAAMII